MSQRAILVSDAETEQRLYRFRYQLYVEERGYHPTEADHDKRLLRDPLDTVSDSFAVVDDSEVIGSFRMTPLVRVEEPSLLIARFAMQPARDAFGDEAISTTSRFMFDSRLLNPRAMIALFSKVYDHLILHHRAIRIAYGDCSAELLPFYQHLGYREYAPTFHDPVFGTKHPIMLIVYDRKTFEVRRSPLARFVSSSRDDESARSWFERVYSPSEKEAECTD